MAKWNGIVGRSFDALGFDKYVRSLKFTTWRPQFVVLHNTGVPTLAAWHDYPGKTRMKGLESYYQGMGWSAGPHLFVADDLIWVFSPLTKPGVHSPSWNAVSWGVEMVGDYDMEPFSSKVRDNAVDALATLHSVMGLQTSSLRFHREDPKTTHKGCPGKNVDKQYVIQRVHQEIIDRHAGEHDLVRHPWRVDP